MMHLTTASFLTFSTTQSLAGFIEGATDILGDVDTTTALENLSYTNKKYNAEKTRVINRFYKIISLHPSLTALTESVMDPEQVNGERITHFFVVQGRTYKTKKKNSQYVHDSRRTEPTQERRIKKIELVRVLGEQETFRKKNMLVRATNQILCHYSTVTYSSISTTRE